MFAHEGTKKDFDTLKNVYNISLTGKIAVVRNDRFVGDVDVSKILKR